MNFMSKKPLSKIHETLVATFSDFGVVAVLSGTLSFRRATFVGTPYYLTPDVREMVQHAEP